MDFTDAGHRDVFRKFFRSPKLFKVEKNAEHRIYKSNNCKVTHLSVKNTAGAKGTGRRIGDYYTIETEKIGSLNTGIGAGESLAEILNTILAQFRQKRICICGLGNPDCISDSLGPATIKMLPAHLLETHEPKVKCNFSKVVTVVPNVLGQTNLVTEEIVAGLASVAKADCVILIDSILTEDISSLCKNIQVTTARGSISHFAVKSDWEMVDVPIIFIGIPTEILMREQTTADTLTVSNIQNVISNGATTLAYALIRACYPELSQGLCKRLLLPREALSLLL